MSADRSADVERRLAALERASDERRAELRELGSRLPAAVSRRSVIVAMANDARSAPNKRNIAVRAVRKALRAPAAIAHRLRARIT